MASEPSGSASQEQLNQIRATEAVALFQANQAGRTAVERVVGLFLSVAAIAGTIAATTHSDQAVIPLPALLFLLLAYMCQRYTDLTVIGMARRRLERLVNDDLGEPALVYETIVAGIPKEPPLKWSVLLQQVTLGVIAVGATVAGFVIALNNGGGWVIVGYLVGTGIAAATAVFSGCLMLKSSDIADKRLEESGLADVKKPTAGS